MEQQRRYKEPQDTLWGKFLSGFMAVVFAMSTLTLIPIASAINGEPNEAQIQQQEELADQTSGKDEKAVEPAADEQKLEPVELLSIASVEDEDDADDAAPADVTLKVKAQNATVTYNGNDVATELVVPADKDVKFTVKAADGFTLGAAAVKLADAKGETTLTPNAGEYTVAADRVADGATVVVTAEAVAGSANTDAAEPSTPAPSTELSEKTANAESIITSIMSFFGGTSMLDARGWGNGNGNAGINPAEVGSYPVYVYTQIHLSSGVTGNSVLNEQATDLIKSLGVALNGNAADNKWYTLGTISNAMTSPGNATGRPGSDADKNRVIENLNSLNRYGNNTFPLDKVSGWGLHTSEAADGYSSSQVIGSSGQSTDGRNITVTWHLDGTATIVKYTWKDGDKVLDTRVGFTGTYTENSEVNEPEAPNGYEFDGWEQDIEGEDVVFNAKWKKNSYAYTVNYYKDSVSDANKIEAQEGWPTGAAAEYQSEVTISPEQRVTIEGKNYILDSADHKIASISATESDNVISVVYAVDEVVDPAVDPNPNEPGDGVPDYRQAVINYVSADDAQGRVAPAQKVVTLEADEMPSVQMIVLDGVTATPETGYVLANWTAEDGTTVAPREMRDIAGGETYTYTANFAKGTYAYTVNYYKDSVSDANKIEAQEGWPTGAAAEYQSEVTISPEQRVTIEGKNYILDSADHKIASISATESDNVISVVYAVDEVVDPAVDPNPNEPGDGVPDYRQAVINYVSADDAQGRVAPAQKVVTLEADEMPSVQMIVLDGVTATPETGYVLANWTAEDGTTVAPREMRDIAGGETYTYTANFKGDFTAISATPYEGVFDGAYHTPTVNGTIEGDTVSFSADHRNVTNGPATVTIKVTRGAETYTIDSTVTITPRPVVVTANDASKIYGEADPTLTAAVRGIEGNTASGLVGNDTVAYTVSRATGEDAGEYDITATGDAVQGNYAVTYMPATFTITAAGGNVVTADNIAGADGLTKMYDGQAASVEAEAARSGSTLLYSTDGVNFTTQNPVFTNAGSYDVYVMATNPNYEDTPVVRTTVTITPAPVTVTVGNAAKTAGAVDPTFAATVTGLVNGESAGLISYTLTRTAGEDAGSYVITAAGDRVQGNYIVTYVPGTLVITAALVPPAALPAGPAAPAAVAALDTILDDGVPLATIDDDENALAAFEEIHCWTHWLMIFGALVTIVYGLAVLYRRRHDIRDMDDFEGDIMGGRKYDAAAEKSPAAGNAFQAM